MTLSRLAIPPFFLALSTLGPSPLCAWPAPVYRNMVYDTLRLMPPRLARVLGRNERFLIEGAYRLEGEMASALARDGTAGRLSSETSREVERRVQAVTEMVNQRRPFREIAVELGKILRIAADLADPTVLGAGEARLARASPEFHRFVLAHLAEIPMVYDRGLPSTLEGSPVAEVLARLTSETTASVSRLAEAHWRGDRLVPAHEFDFRSVPYAVASLGYSRGVTAASHLWLAAWSAANGDLTGTPFARKLPPRHFLHPQKGKP